MGDRLMAKPSRTIIANVYKTYSFRDKDPVIDQLRTMTKDSGRKTSEIAHAAGLSPTTPTNWFKKGVRRPQSASVEAYGRALGKKRVWVDLK
jgi:DNA invertase Pin-like site-specific DNA recombinase